MDLVTAPSYLWTHLAISRKLELKADLQLCHKHQAKPLKALKAAAYSRSTPGNRLHSAESPCGF